MEAEVDNFTKGTLAAMAIQLAVMGFTISKLCYELGYEKGKAAVYRSFAEDGTEGTCYAKGGCLDKSTTAHVSHKR